MKLSLPISGTEVEIMDFVPHRVAAPFIEASQKAIDPSLLSREITKQELMADFGTDAIKELEELKEPEYSERLKFLKAEYLKRRMKSVDMAVIHEANRKKIVGMLVTPIPPLDELPHEDVEAILEAIEKVWDDQRKKKLAAQQKG